MLNKLSLLFLIITSNLFASPAIKDLELPVRASVVYDQPSKRFNDYYSYETIIACLKSHGLSLEHKNFFEHLIPHEQLGFFGVHSSTQHFRIFQDIIRISLEELCDLEIRDNFHFLRVPGNPVNSTLSAKEFLSKYPFINDHLPDQRAQLLSLNYALFGNFNMFGECSVYYFTANHSASDVAYQKEIRTLFDFLGVPADEIPQLFLIGDRLTRTDNAILLQFFDLSHHNPYKQFYELVDQLCYPAIAWGGHQPIPSPLSKLYLNDAPTPFTQQFRLVINNTVTLNPYSALHIVRYDRVDPQITLEYERQLRAAIKQLPFDPQKTSNYKKLLLTLWGGQDEQN